MAGGMTGAQGARVLLLGCGQLGSRHLQAVVSLPQVAHIDVVDPRAEALDLGRERIGEVEDRNAQVDIRWLTSLDQAAPDGDLCIIATLADRRPRLMREVAETLGYRAFLLEKVVTQSVAEYESLLEFSQQHALRVWVNCKSRAYPIHQHIKRQLDPADPVVVSGIGGNQGLANNGVHTADLFVFYSGAQRIHSGGSTIDPVAHPSKRGVGLFDLSGTLHGYADGGSQFTLSYQGDHDSPELFTITTRRYRCVIDHLQRWAAESDAASGWRRRPVTFEGDLRVSTMTRAFVAEILATGRCDLPTLADAFPAHRFILEELLPAFQRLLGIEGDRCPVT